MIIHNVVLQLSHHFCAEQKSKMQTPSKFNIHRKGARRRNQKFLSLRIQLNSKEALHFHNSNHFIFKTSSSLGKLKFQHQANVSEKKAMKSENHGAMKIKCQYSPTYSQLSVGYPVLQQLYKSSLYRRPLFSTFTVENVSSPKIMQFYSKKRKLN